MLTARKIRSIIEQHPLPDKALQNVLEQWMIDLAEEIVENMKNEQSHLATKDDMKQVKDDIKDDIKQVIEMMNARFEAMEKANVARFEAIDKRFEAMEKANASRFEAIDKRFEALLREMDKRFEAMEKANVSYFRSLEKRLLFMQWLIGGGVLLFALKLFFPHIFPH